MSPLGWLFWIFACGFYCWDNHPCQIVSQLGVLEFLQQCKCYTVIKFYGLRWKLLLSKVLCRKAQSLKCTCTISCYWYVIAILHPQFCLPACVFWHLQFCCPHRILDSLFSVMLWCYFWSLTWIWNGTRLVSFIIIQCQMCCRGEQQNGCQSRRSGTTAFHGNRETAVGTSAMPSVCHCSSGLCSDKIFINFANR